MGLFVRAKFKNLLSGFSALKFPFKIAMSTGKMIGISEDCLSVASSAATYHFEERNDQRFYGCVGLDTSCI